jgi:hypothetical protein
MWWGYIFKDFAGNSSKIMKFSPMPYLRRFKLTCLPYNKGGEGNNHSVLVWNCMRMRGIGRLLASNRLAYAMLIWGFRQIFTHTFQAINSKLLLNEQSPFHKNAPCAISISVPYKLETPQAPFHQGSVCLINNNNNKKNQQDMWAHLWTSVHSIQYWYKVRQRRWDWILGQSICHVPSTWLDNKRTVLLPWQRSLNTFKHCTTHTPTNQLKVERIITGPTTSSEHFQAHHPYLHMLLQVKVKRPSTRGLCYRLTHSSSLVQILIPSLIWHFCCYI